MRNGGADAGLQGQAGVAAEQAGCSLLHTEEGGHVHVRLWHEYVQRDGSHKVSDHLDRCNEGGLAHHGRPLRVRRIWSAPYRQALAALGVLPTALLLDAGWMPLRAEPPDALVSPGAMTPTQEKAEIGELERLLAARPVLNQPLTVDQAVEIALRESPMVRAAVAERDAAVGRLNMARAETRPMISANTFLSGGSMPNIVGSPESPTARMIMALPQGGFVDLNLMTMYPLFTSGRLQAMIRQATSLRGASAATLDAQRQEVALMTRVAYREVLAKRSLVEVARVRLQDNEERLRLDRERLAQERIPAFYVRRGEAEVASAKQEVSNAQRDALIALSQLKTFMGISLASHLDLSEKLEYEPIEGLIKRLTGSAISTSTAASSSVSPPGLTPPGMTPDLAALVRLGVRQRPELRAIRERISGARAGEAATRAGYRPQVNLFAMGDAAKMRGERSTGGITYGVTATLPLYTGGGDRARVQMAEAERRQQEAEAEQLVLRVAKEVNDAYFSLAAAEQNVQTARAALEAAQEEYRAAGARYDAGRSIVTEVLDALAVRVRAESDVVQALLQYNVSQDQLLRAVGEITPSVGHQNTAP